MSTLLNFVKMFSRAHDENCKQLELEKKKAEKEAESEKLKPHAPHKISGTCYILRSRVSNNLVPCNNTSSVGIIIFC